MSALVSGSSAYVAFMANTLPILQWFAAALAVMAGMITVGSWVVRGIASWTLRNTEAHAEKAAAVVSDAAVRAAEVVATAASTAADVLAKAAENHASRK